jgi:crotonobetaine/carnitine-CoA ligase
MMDSAGQRSLVDLLDECVARRPEARFLTVENLDGSISTTTFAEFGLLVDRAAKVMADAGFGYGSKIVIHKRTHLDFVVAWFAVASLGAVSVPMNVDYARDEVTHAVRLVAAEAAIIDPEWDELYASLAQENGRVLVLGHFGSTGELGFDGALTPRAAEPRRPDADDLLQLLFTSGTTSRPKAAELTHAAAVHAGDRTAKQFGIEPGDLCMTALPLYHVNAQTMALLPAVSVGAGAVLLAKFSATRYWRQVLEYGVTFTSILGMQLRTLLAQRPSPDERNHRLKALSFFINVSDADKEQFEARFGVTLLNGFGLTEAMGVVASTPRFAPQRWPSVGVPAAERQVKIVDEHGVEVPAGTVGAIAVRGTPGRTIMRGYHGDPEATDRAIRGDWLHTGDLGHLDEHGYLYFNDRSVDLIKRSGENISAREVEACLLEHPDVVEVVVIGTPDPIRDERVKALVLARRDEQLSGDVLAEFCATRLAKYKIPTDWEFVDDFPRTKIKRDPDKKLLRQREKDQFEKATSKAADQPEPGVTGEA